jgi:hypothetical protein
MPGTFRPNIQAIPGSQKGAALGIPGRADTLPAGERHPVRPGHQRRRKLQRDGRKDSTAQRRDPRVVDVQLGGRAHTRPDGQHRQRSQAISAAVVRTRARGSARSAASPRSAPPFVRNAAPVAAQHRRRRQLQRDGRKDSTAQRLDPRLVEPSARRSCAHAPEQPASPAQPRSARPSFAHAPAQPRSAASPRSAPPSFAAAPEQPASPAPPASARRSEGLDRSAPRCTARRPFSSAVVRTRARAASIAGAASFSASVVRVRARSASISGNAALTGALIRVRSRTAAIAGQTAISCTLAGTRSITTAISGRAVFSLVLVTTSEEQPPASTPSGGGISRSPIAHRRPEFTITRPRGRSSSRQCPSRLARSSPLT